MVERSAPRERLAALLVLLLPAQRAHQHLAAGAVDVRQHRAGRAQDQLAHLVRMPGAARLDDGQRAVALAAADDVGEVDPRIGDGRDLQVGRLAQAFAIRSTSRVRSSNAISGISSTTGKKTDST